MTALTNAVFWHTAKAKTAPTSPPRTDWLLMGDVATIRAGVPELLIRWRKAERKAPSQPADLTR